MTKSKTLLKNSSASFKIRLFKNDKLINLDELTLMDARAFKRIAKRILERLSADY